MNKKQGNQDNTKVTFYDKISRVRPRFFDQVGHETMYTSSRNKRFP